MLFYPGAEHVKWKESVYLAFHPLSLSVGFYNRQMSFPHRPALVLRPDEPVSDERSDRDPRDLERVVLEVDLDWLVRWVRALWTKLHAALVLNRTGFPGGSKP